MPAPVRGQIGGAIEALAALGAAVLEQDDAGASVARQPERVVELNLTQFAQVRADHVRDGGYLRLRLVRHLDDVVLRIDVPGLLRLVLVDLVQRSNNRPRHRRRRELVELQLAHRFHSLGLSWRRGSAGRRLLRFRRRRHLDLLPGRRLLLLRRFGLLLLRMRRLRLEHRLRLGLHCARDALGVLCALYDMVRTLLERRSLRRVGRSYLAGNGRLDGQVERRLDAHVAQLQVERQLGDRRQQARLLLLELGHYWHRMI